MNELMTLTFEGCDIRITDRDGKPWWVAADVCRSLEVGNVSHALSRLKGNQKGIILNDTPGGAQQMAIISESGLYALIMKSRKPCAERFQDWVTDEVLPSIRKTGGYGAAPGLTAADVVAICAEAIAKALAAHTATATLASAEAIAKATEFGPQVVDTDLITVGELVDNLTLPKDTNRLSVSQQLKYRLIEFCKKNTIRSQLSRGVWRFAAKQCGDEAQRLTKDLINGAASCELRKKLRKERKEAREAGEKQKGQTVLPFMVRTDTPAMPPGAA